MRLTMRARMVVCAGMVLGACASMLADVSAPGISGGVFMLTLMLEVGGVFVLLSDRGRFS